MYVCVCTHTHTRIHAHTRIYNSNKFLHLKLCVKINGWKWIMCYSSNFILLSTLLKYALILMHTTSARWRCVKRERDTHYTVCFRCRLWLRKFIAMLGTCTPKRDREKALDTRNKMVQIKNQMVWHDKRNDCHSVNS